MESLCDKKVIKIQDTAVDENFPPFETKTVVKNASKALQPQINLVGINRKPYARIEEKESNKGKFLKSRKRINDASLAELKELTSEMILGKPTLVKTLQGTQRLIAKLTIENRRAEAEVKEALQRHFELKDKLKRLQDELRNN